MKIILFSVFLLILLVSCSIEYDGILKSSDEKFNLGLNQILYISYQDTFYNQEEHIWITFDSLLHDSRCPVDVVCDWQGNARLSFIFGKNENKERFNLNTYQGFTRDTLLYGYRISLVGVLPVPYSEVDLKPEDYIAKILIEK